MDEKENDYHFAEEKKAKSMANALCNLLNDAGKKYSVDTTDWGDTCAIIVEIEAEKGEDEKGKVFFVFCFSGFMKIYEGEVE